MGQSCLTYFGTKGGEKSLRSQVNVQQEQLEWEMYVAEAIGELVANAPKLTDVPSIQRVAETILIYVNNLAAGNIAEFSRKFGITSSKLYQWKQGVRTPKLINLLELCNAIDIKPIHFLSKNITVSESKVEFEKHTSSDAQDQHNVKYALKTDDEIRQILDDLIAHPPSPFPSLRQVSICTGRSRAYLSKYFPNQIKDIKKRIKIDSENKKKNLQQVLDLLLKNENCPPPSVTKVARQLGVGKPLLRKWFPDECQVIETRYRGFKASKKLQFKQYLEQILIENVEVPLSLWDISRQTGHSLSYLKKNFPDQCDQIIQRYKEYQTTSKKRRLQQLYDEVQEIVVELAEQGIYPSARKVGNLLPKPGFMKSPVAIKARQDTLRELGCPLTIRITHC